MNPKTLRFLTQAFLVGNLFFWLPWGFICLIWPQAWSGEVIPNMNVFDLSGAVARTEVRAMYGGVADGDRGVRPHSCAASRS
jgi:hypothetical protein